MKIYTVGHSNQSARNFLDLISAAKIGEIVDVRSRPQSRHSPQFNQAALAVALGDRRINYRFMGDRLGGRPRDPSLLVGGQPSYERMGGAADFSECLDEILDRAKRKRLALMCAEHEPLECHRCILIGRRLVESGVKVAHILRTGEIEPHEKTEDRLLALHHLDDDDLLEPRAKRLARAYRAQEASFRGETLAASPRRKTAR